MNINGSKKIKLFMVQACDEPNDSVSIPFSIGVLAAYAWQNEIIRDRYKLCGLFSEKTNINTITEIIDSESVIAFSCYIWNFEYSKCMAKRIKEMCPDCIVIFGGHSIPIRNNNLLRELTYVDYFIHGEGEIPFTELLLYLCQNMSLENVHNISYIKNGDIQYRYDINCIVADYPSPYLSGFFDNFKNIGEKVTATLETNRGCPFQCAYCDWGLNKTRLRMMNLQKVFDEIEWMGRNGVVICYGADSNFGMFPRDIEIAKKISEVKAKYGYPRKLSVSFAKKSDERVLEICKILSKCGVLSGATLSFQSLNFKTLEIIGRKNLSIEYFSKLMTEYNKNQIPTYSELILALPGETYESFINGICTLISCGQYRYINIYHFALLVNSELGTPESVKKYDLKTVKFPSKLYYTQVDKVESTVPEFTNIVVQTSTMTKTDWVNCSFVASVIKGFHSYGILLYIAMFLHISEGIAYKAFYESLCSWIFDTDPFSSYIELYKWLNTVAFECEVSLETEIFNGYIVPAEEVAFLKAKENIDEMYSKLSGFISRYQKSECWDSLVRFQKVIFEFIYDGRCEEVELPYDFISYFNNALLGNAPYLSSKKIIVNRDALDDLLFLPKKIYVPQKYGQHKRG